MSLPDLLVVGTDTDAGKTTLAALLLHAGLCHPKPWSYWKPVQSGPPDTGRIRELAPHAEIHPARHSYAHPAAPDVAAQVEGVAEPSVADLVATCPQDHPLLIESVGGPLSPLRSDTLQIELLTQLQRPAVLVTPNRVGAIHQTLTTLQTLEGAGIACRAIVLLGPSCEDNLAAVRRHGSGVPTFEIDWPAEDTPAAYEARAADLAPVIEVLTMASTADTSNDLRERDARHLWHPYTPLVGETDRPVCLRAEREWLHLDTGEALVDGISSWWTCIHGHAHPHIREALRTAARQLDQVIFAGMTHEPGVELACRLLDRLPDPFDRVFYSDNGSTAVEVALKIVAGGWHRRGQPERRRFLCFEGAYHGDTFGTLSVGRDPVFASEYEDMMFEVVQVPYTVAAVEEALEQHRDTLAGAILEPLVQGACGMRYHDVATIDTMCARLKAARIPVIFDEVMTGFGRTGTLFALEQLDTVPDVLCLAKGLSGGVLPLAATVVTDAQVEPWLEGGRARMLFHGHSFTANPLACATGLAGFDLFDSGVALEGTRRIEAFWRQARDQGVLPATTRICGTIAAFERGAGGGYLGGSREHTITTAREHGVFLRPLGDTVYAMPPLCTGIDSLERIAKAMSACAT